MKHISPKQQVEIMQAIAHPDSTEITPDCVFEIAAGGFIAETGGLIVNNDIYCIGPNSIQILENHPIEDGWNKYYAYS